VFSDIELTAIYRINAVTARACFCVLCISELMNVGGSSALHTTTAAGETQCDNNVSNLQTGDIVTLSSCVLLNASCLSVLSLILVLCMFGWLVSGVWDL